jgi:putative spermidine/putrescine transport system permease protein
VHIRRRGDGVYYLAAVPGALLLLFAFYLPLGSIGLRSIHADASASFSVGTLSIEHFTNIFHDDIARRVIWNTLKTSLLSTLIAVGLGYPLCIVLRNVSPTMRKVAVVIVTITFWTSILVRLYAWTIILGRRGLINSALSNIGLIDQPLDLLFNTGSVVAGMSNFLLPYAVLVLLAPIMSVDEDLLAAARGLGAREAAVYWNIFIPATMPALLGALIICFALAVGYYITPAVLGGPGNVTVPVYIQQRARFLEWGPVSALSMLLLVTTLALTGLVMRVMPPGRLFGGD